ncbi:membrane integrity-associated transporter subunit PqiC [Pacificimonas sp. WHA3]|uniref:Membrane integrity-associated transporter subunit PqiC n=1 Tax=Pacificimonas pallii TaxID=2827236 RepID=A0ABS6SHF5_9SPHN|nr:ABC-type transport auxiliary lipoprotein family protein [Pacificimonas pallii]MBV7257834.1 membrane integrity-associated transporter subunit PqiC [Pacificimonas pallii]
MRLNLVNMSAAILMLAACGPLVQVGGNAPPAASLLTLAATATAPEGTSGAPLLIVRPDVPGALRTTRIPVQTAQNELQYLDLASWVEQPNILFQRVLADTFEARSGRPAMDERNIDVVPAARLSGKLMEFGLDVSAERVVRVRYDAVLTSANDGLLGTRRFEATEPVSSETGPAIASALGRAANRLAADIADWAGEKSS